MDFRRQGARHGLWLPARSLLIMDRDARLAWAHYIPHRKADPVLGRGWVPRGRRISFTFRQASRSVPDVTRLLHKATSSFAEHACIVTSMLDSLKQVFWLGGTEGQAVGGSARCQGVCACHAQLIAWQACGLTTQTGCKLPAYMAHACPCHAVQAATPQAGLCYPLKLQTNPALLCTGPGGAMRLRFPRVLRLPVRSAAAHPLGSGCTAAAGWWASCCT